MPIFKYKAIARDGTTITGNVDAANEADLDLRVTRMELELISFSAARARFGSRKKVTRRDLITFCYHLEQLTRAGVPIHEGLVDLRDSVDNPVFREVISAITQSIEAGKTLSQALAEHPKVFDDVFAQLIAFGFSPFFWNLHFGQNTGFLLFGLAGFAWFRPTRPMLAGAFAALTAIKPHLLAVFGVLMLWDAWNRDGRRALIGGIGVLLLGSAVALAVQPHIFGLFVEALRRPTTPETVRLADWQVPLLSYQFRQAVDPDRFWLQFLPLGVACIAILGWHWKRRIDWPDALPWVVVLSCLAAPYGGWIFDLTVLMLPVLFVLGRFDSPSPKRSGGTGLIAILGLALISWFGFRIQGLPEPIWFTPAVAVVLGYGWYRSRANP